MNRAPRKIPTQISPAVERVGLSPRQVGAEFKQILVHSAKFQIPGSAKTNPDLLWQFGLVPRHKIDLFGYRFYLTHVKQIPELRFFIAYVVPPSSKTKNNVFARVFYKDLSLVWRAASHYAIESSGDFWIGKGDVKEERSEGLESYIVSDEATTDLPLEMQNALESLIPLSGQPKGSQRLIELVLRRSPADRVEPYADFTRPRQQAAAVSANLINQGKPIARFRRANDPTSLRIVKGFEPDFVDGLLETSSFKSRLYGGRLQRYRFLSKNKTIQYIFFAAPKHVWIVPPQATTTQLSSYGVRTITVASPDDMFLPGYEYHHYEETENGTELYSQIPDGYAGQVCPYDDAKADASPWLNKLPIVQEFRRVVLRKNS